MSGFQSNIRDAINQVAPAHATVSVANRGLSHFIDPTMTGRVRFMQKSGFPFSLLTPQIEGELTVAASAGSRVATVKNSGFIDWAIPGVVVSFELLEDVKVESSAVNANGTATIVLSTDLTSSHAASTKVTIRSFPVSSPSGAEEGDGGPGRPAVTLTSPFILAPGDVLNVNGKLLTLNFVSQVSPGTYEVRFAGINGIEAISSSTALSIVARPLYQSEVLSLPHLKSTTLTAGPVAVDWISGPMVADYLPDPESECYIEEFDSSGTLAVGARKVEKNDTLTRLPINRDQLLFWRAAEGGMDWDGSFTILRAYDSGRVHLWTPCRPGLDPAPLLTRSFVVPGFSPYKVLLLNRISPDSVSVLHAVTKAVIDPADYTVDETAGSISFDSTYASQPVIVTYRPRMEWQFTASPSESGIELVVKVGQEDKQVFTLGSAGTTSTITVQVTDDVPVNQFHVTARRSSDVAGPFSVRIGDWTPRSGTTSAIRYTISTGATANYDWASSGLLLKALWPNLNLLRASLDGESLFAKYLDNGRALL